MLPRSPSKPPMKSLCKPNARRPAMPAMPLARHGLGEDDTPSEQVLGRSWLGVE